MTTPPANPKIYHIVHVDRLPSILTDRFLFSDAVMANRGGAGTIIGMEHIKQRRLSKELASHNGLTVGQCVPFYFCPRSVMLNAIHNKVSDLDYKGGQSQIVHLEADLHQVIDWAGTHTKRWAFTTGNAGSSYFDDYNDIKDLDKLDWAIIGAKYWSQNRDGKQAEFLMEELFPWELFEVIGVYNQTVYNQVKQALHGQVHCPTVAIKHDWYY